MKIITTKLYKQLSDGYRSPTSFFTYKQRCEDLEKQLAEAKDLKAILEKLCPVSDFYNSLTTMGGVLSVVQGDYELNLPDNVLVSMIF